MNSTLHSLLPVVGDLTFTHAKVRSPTTGSKDRSSGRMTSYVTMDVIRNCTLAAPTVTSGGRPDVHTCKSEIAHHWVQRPHIEASAKTRGSL